MVTQRYKDYMKSERWQRKRQMVFNYYGKRCYACSTIAPPIQVHHLDYSRFGNEPLTDLMPLCQKCHRQVTYLYKKNRRRGLRRITMEYVNHVRKLRKMGHQPDNKGQKNERVRTRTKKNRRRRPKAL